MLVRFSLHERIRRPWWWLSNLLLVGGIGALLAGGWALLDGTLYQAVQKRQFKTFTNTGGEEGTASQDSVPSAIRETAPGHRLLFSILPKRDELAIGELTVPRLGLDVMMREGIDDASLRKAVGHLPASVLPGQAGNFVVLGHRDTFFRPLRDIERGDIIRASTRAGKFVYKVESIQVTEPDWPAAVAQTREPVVTLITCFPFKYIGAAPRRFIVRGKLSAE